MLRFDSRWVKMLISSLSIPDVLVFEPPLHEDNRGSFCVPYNKQLFDAAVGKPISFVQDNETFSKEGVLRGLHYQIENTQGKLVRVLHGVGETLSAENRKSLWVPEGFAHGFLVLSKTALFMYKVTASWSPGHECCIRFDDPDLGISWPVENISVLVSPRDAKGKAFKEAPVFHE